MRLMDLVVTWIRNVLGFLPGAAVEFLWLPVFALVVVIAVRLVMRKVVPPAGQAAERLLGAAVAVASVPVMLVILAVATPFRRLRRNPPALLIGLDDALVTTANAVLASLHRVSWLAAKASGTRLILAMLIAGLVIWRWDAWHCGPSHAEFAAQQVAQQAAQTTGGQQAAQSGGQQAAQKTGGQQAGQPAAGDPAAGQPVVQAMAACTRPVGAWAERIGIGGADGEPEPIPSPATAP
jgi:hypothetical protein